VSITVRPARSDDAAAVAAVHVQAWRETYAGIFPADELERLSVDRRTAMWGELLAHPGAFVACDGARIVGFVHVAPCRDEDLQGADEITSIYVLRSHHGLGAGRALMEACLEAHRSDVVALWVLERNGRARRFYEAAGFALDGATRPAGVFGSDLPMLRYRRERSA